MIEIVVAIVGALLGLFIHGAYIKNKAAKGQKELEDKVKRIAQETKALTEQAEAEKKAAQEKVDAISKEQETKLEGQSLADWFDSRNKPKQ